MLCFIGELLSRLLISTATSRGFLYLLLYTLLPAASSLGVPVMTIAVKRYTTLSSRCDLLHVLSSMTRMHAWHMYTQHHGARNQLPGIALRDTHVRMMTEHKSLAYGLFYTVISI